MTTYENKWENHQKMRLFSALFSLFLFSFKIIQIPKKGVGKKEKSFFFFKDDTKGRARISRGTPAIGGFFHLLRIILRPAPIFCPAWVAPLLVPAWRPMTVLPA